MNKTLCPDSFRYPAAIHTSRSVRNIRSWSRFFVGVFAAILLCIAQARGTGYTDGFETYNLGALDSTYAGGPNEGVDGGANPWFGSAPPNFRVVNAENGVNPHSGNNMIRGCLNCHSDRDVEWFNLSYRCATGGVYMGNFA